jgi:para-nitrobenzyl esterase
MLDIVAALTWVRENIGGLGGDAGSVTVFGQSGGGYKLCHLLAMPAARGLFHKAIIQSGASLRAGTQEDSLKLTAGVMQELGLTAGDVSGLQNASVDRLLGARLAAQQKLRIYTDPVVDGRVLPNRLFEPATSAVSGDVPLLIGTTLHEEGVNDVSTEDALRLSVLTGARHPPPPTGWR